MLTNNDIQKLSEVFASKHDITELKHDVGELKKDVAQIKVKINHDIPEMKKDLEGLRESMQILLTGMDGIAKVMGDLRMEYTGMAMQLNRHEKWIKELANRIGIALND